MTSLDELVADLQVLEPARVGALASAFFAAADDINLECYRAWYEHFGVNCDVQCEASVGPKLNEAERAAEREYRNGIIPATSMWAGDKFEKWGPLWMRRKAPRTGDKQR